jgi:uncharacterized LabA/DUF88 family protein
LNGGFPVFMYMSGRKVIFYIDGFNIYNGLKDSRMRRYYWLDVEKFCATLAKRFIRNNYEIRLIRFFTSRTIRSLSPRRYGRQETYLKALKTLNKVKITKGKYKTRSHTCSNCLTNFDTPVEKMTDVNIASMMYYDAAKDYCDIQVLISGDTDLQPITRIIKRLYNKTLIVLFPLRRETDALKRYCDLSGKIFKDTYKTCQFSNPLTCRDGRVLNKPQYWS